MLRGGGGPTEITLAPPEAGQWDFVQVDPGDPDGLATVTDPGTAPAPQFVLRYSIGGAPDVTNAAVTVFDNQATAGGVYLVEIVAEIAWADGDGNVISSYSPTKSLTPTP